MSKKYEMYKITLKDYIRYRICVPKDQLEEFEEWSESKDITSSEWVGETDDDVAPYSITVMNSPTDVMTRYT